MANHWDIVAKTKAAEDREGIGKNDQIDFSRLLENEKHLLVIYIPIKSSISGFILKKENTGIIVINENRSSGHKRFTLAHELYHWKYDDTTGLVVCSVDSTKPSPTERAANTYASYLLMPQDGLEAFLARRKEESDVVSIEDQIHIQQIYQISHAFLAVRLHTLKLKPEKVPAKQKITQLALGLGYSDELYSTKSNPVSKSDYLQRVQTLLENGKISEGKYKELLRVTNIEAFK